MKNEIEKKTLYTECQQMNVKLIFMTDVVYG